MLYKKRVETTRVLISGHQALASSPRLNDIIAELNYIISSSRSLRRSGWLLVILHTTRALDTTLKEAINYKGWRSRQSLGGYLFKFEAESILTRTEKTHYQQNIVDIRNTYMHEAGAMPRRSDADAILAEMYT